MKNIITKITMKNLLIAALILPLSACINMMDQNGNPGMFAPKPLFLRNLPQGNDKYSMGFRDGCYNFIGQNGNGALRLYDRYASPAASLLADKYYQQGYRNGDRYCGVYVNKNIIL